MDPLGILEDAGRRSGEALELAARHLDPSLVDVLRIIGFDQDYVSARGSYLYDSGGRAFLDLHTGEGFASLGHNHPDVRAVLQATLGEDLLDGVQIHYSALAGMLAEALAAHLPRGLEAMFFASTGAEAVDAAMKFSRAASGRTRFVSCHSSFHGVTLGPLSIVGDEFFRRASVRCWEAASSSPSATWSGSRNSCAGATWPPSWSSRSRAAPLPRSRRLPEGGPGAVPALRGDVRARRDPDRPRAHRQVVRPGRVGTGARLRAGRQGAQRRLHAGRRDGHHEGHLSAGRGDAGALDTSHQSTYGRNRLSMAAGLATIRIIERDGLVEHSAQVGALLREGLAELQGRHEIIKEVRGRGLMIGIELGAPRGSVARVSWRLVRVAAEGLYPQLIVIPLHRDHGVITMAAGKNDVIKLLPPMTLSEAEAQRFLDAFAVVLADCEGSTSKNWAVVRDIAKATLTRRGREPAGASGGSGPRADRGIRATEERRATSTARRATRWRPRRRLERARMAGACWSRAPPASSGGAWR